MNQTRRQLTLFVNPQDSFEIERVREELNPCQFEIIKAHATLCREDEIADLERVLANLRNLKSPSVTINFGEPIRFSDGKGVLIPTAGDNKEFQNLRKTVLSGVIENPRLHEPHITLMHPRNSLCTDEIFSKILHRNLPKLLTFNQISLIEQQIGRAWNVLEEFPQS